MNYLENFALAYLMIMKSQKKIKRIILIWKKHPKNNHLKKMELKLL